VILEPQTMQKRDQSRAAFINEPEFRHDPGADLARRTRQCRASPRLQIVLLLHTSMQIVGRSVAGSPAGSEAGLGRAFPPAPPQARPTPYYVSFSSVRLIELSILFKRELFAVFDHCIFGVRRICFYDFNTLGNAFESAAFAAPRIKRYVEIPFIGFRAAAGVV